MEIEFDADDLAYVLGSDPSPAVLQSAERRASDRALLRRGAEAAKAFQPALDAALAAFQKSHPELCAGLACSGQAQFRPAPTKGGAKVLVRLMEVILSPASAERTQKECREIVAAEFQNHAVVKTWTKPLPGWAVARAKAMIAGASTPISGLRLKTGVTLKDLHSAVRTAVHGSAVEACVKISIADDSVVINGHRFSRSVNRVKGKEYAFVRLTISGLEAALLAKPKAR